MFTFWDYLLTFGEEVGLDFHKKKTTKISAVYTG